MLIEITPLDTRDSHTQSSASSDKMLDARIIALNPSCDICNHVLLSRSYDGRSSPGKAGTRFMDARFDTEYTI